MTYFVYENIRLTSNGVIVLANMSIAWMLYGLYRRKAPAPPAPTAVLLFAALIFLCGASHLGLMFVGQPPARPVLTVLKVLAAAFWLATAVRLPKVIARLSGPPLDLEADQAAANAVQALLMKAERLRIKTRMLEDFVRNESWLFDKTDDLEELELILADLEAELCKI